MVGAGNNKQASTFILLNHGHHADIPHLLYFYLITALPSRNHNFNDATHTLQFNILAEKVLENPSLAANPKFATNDARVKNRTELVRIITGALMKHDRDHWLQRFTGLGSVGVHTNPQIQHFKTYEVTGYRSVRLTILNRLSNTLRRVHNDCPEKGLSNILDMISGDCQTGSGRGKGECPWHGPRCKV